MSSDLYEIPRHGNAGVAFLGVELGDASIVIVSVFLGLLTGMKYGPVAYLGVPVAGYFLNKLYVDWRSKALPGQLRQQLFEMGLVGYGRCFKGSDVVFLGDATVINRGASELVDGLSESLRQTRRTRNTHRETIRGNQGA